MGVGKVSDTKYTDSKVICPICYGEGAREVCPRRGKNYEADEGLHLCPSIHAERNAIVQAARLGIKIKGSSLYVNYFTPCKDCLVEIINAGIKEVICEGNKYNDKLSGWLIENSSLLIRKYNDANGEE
jgi:dCMP deaminase